MGILAHRIEDAAAKVYVPSTEQNFASIHSRFKVNLLLPDGTGLCYYGQEASASIEEMMLGWVQEVELDARKGLGDCEHFLANTRYETAVLYRREGKQWKSMAWYLKGEIVMTEYIPFVKPISRCRLLLQNEVLTVEEIERVAA